MADSPINFVVVARIALILHSLKKNLDYMEGTLKDVTDGKPPPARSPTWQAVIDDANDMENSLHTLKWFTVERGDVSPASQKDCAKYQGVLTAFKDWYDALVASESDAPKLLSQLKDVKNTLDERSHSASELQKLMQGLAASANQAIRNYAGWAYLDLDKVVRALNGASSEASARITKVQAFQDALSQRIDGAKKDLENYQSRIPAMRDYCAHHRPDAPMHLVATD